MRLECHKKNPSLHYAAMDEPGAESKWYLLAAKRHRTDRVTTRIVESVTTATMHTFTSVDYTAILRTYGIVESNAKSFGLDRAGAMRDYGMKTMQSAVQIVIYQRRIEKYGGEPWKLNTLPPVVAKWYSTLDRDLKNDVEKATWTGASVGQVVNSVMGKLGAIACRDASIAKSVQRVLTGEFRIGVASGDPGEVGFHIIKPQSKA